MKTKATLLYAGNSFYVKFIDELKEDLVFTYESAASIMEAVNGLLAAVKEQDLDILNKDSFRFFSESMDSLCMINESNSPDAEALMEFEMFNVNRRDITSFADFMKGLNKRLEVPTMDKKGAVNKFKIGFMHEIKRDPTFKHPAFDNLYKSFGEKDKKKREENEGGNYVTPGGFPAGVGGF